MIKKILTLFFGFFAFTMFGQDVANATDIEKKLAAVNVETLTNRLILNVNQKEKMLEVVTLYEMNKNLIFKSEGGMEEKNAKLEELEKTHHAKVGEVLTPEQFEKFNALITEAKSGS